MCVCVTSEEHALTEVAAHVVHADGLHSKQIQHIGGDGRNDGFLNGTQTKTVNLVTAKFTENMLTIMNLKTNVNLSNDNSHQMFRLLSA